jgi:hypothetical protein
LFFIGHLWIPEFRTVSKYANFGNIRPIWERIFPIKIEYFFENFLSISFRIWIVSNRTTSISVEVYEYCRYLMPSSTLLTFASFPCKSIVSCHFPLLLPSSHLCNDSFNYGGKKAVVHRPLEFQPRLPSLDKPMCTWLTEPTSLLRYGIN